MVRTEGEIELMGESGQAAAVQRERERETELPIEGEGNIYSTVFGI